MFGKLTFKEKVLIFFLLIIVVWVAIVLFDLRDPTRKYRNNQFYCKMDTDCQIVLDPLSNACLSVNNLHKDKYDMDTQCRHRIAKCSVNLCTAP
ncbi:MAG: hypothetical protein WCO55_03765 [Candidatus Falkowbacteria bacterium]